MDRPRLTLANIGFHVSKVIATAGIAGALAVFGYKVYFFLKFGQSLPITVVDALIDVSDAIGLRSSHFVAWLTHPESRLVIHHFLSQVPATLAIFTIGLLPLLLSLGLSNVAARRTR